MLGSNKLTTLRTTLAALLTLTCLAIASPPAYAEKAPEDKAKAEIVITGKVNRIFTRRDGRLTEYVVRIIIDEVHKGENLKPSEALYTYVFQKSAPLFPTAEPRGHSAIPKEGQTIKAYIHHRAGRHEGNYKDGFEVVQPTTKKE